METSYKVVPFRTDGYETRYCVVSAETSEILDDAQGYGYKTIQKAHAAYRYKTRDRSKDAEKRAKERKIRKWLKEHSDFSSAMDRIAFEIAKGSWGPDDKFDAKLVRQMLKESGLEPNFSAGDLLKIWRRV